ncbi:MAG TPA: AsmA-like C-terminal region-containing protein [Terracidiphilus sp.]|nr:AsmA-like C-terminal region-containing protein [Terracidiphilus sp.]
MKHLEMETEEKHREGTITRRPFWRRHRWLLWTLIAAGGVIGALSIVLAVAARRFQPYLQARIVSGLEERFHTRVELDHLRISVHHGQEAEWGLWATGRGLRIWPPQRTGGDRPLEIAVQSMPLIQLDEFSFHVPLLLKRIEQGKPLHIAEVRLTGLTVRIPPKSERDNTTGLTAALKSRPADGQQSPQAARVLSRILVDRVVCDKTDLVLETDKPGKLPLEYDLVHLKVMHLKAGEPMAFAADLINARPSGLVHTTGTFGPWDVDDPGASPVSGKYVFNHANLGDFKGIGGTLASDGAYDGMLRNIAIDGEANVPNFSLSQFGTALTLHTNFHAHVDGTDGDTYLDEVNAILGRSKFTTSGKIVRITPEEIAAAKAIGSQAPGPGHMIDLKIEVPHGQIDDFMRLVSKSNTPLMTGTLEAHAVLHIPPGDKPVYQRLKLDGKFDVEGARFTSEKVQGHIEDLSLRGQGHPGDLKDADPNSVVSQMKGNFHMANGSIALPDLHYAVPGADIQLKGTYALQGALNFDGTARMQATVSQMVGGWKGFLIRPADRFFKKDGAGTLVPIRIRGTRQQPDFSVDFGHLSHTTPERPGDKRQ